MAVPLPNAARVDLNTPDATEVAALRDFVAAGRPTMALPPE
jgi:hypothetical protein